MDYEKKYNEALEWARKVMQGKVGFVLDDVLELFPELKESKDDKIRKWLICTLKSLNNSPVQIDGAYEMMLPAIAWLEKKGEKKPIEEVNGDDYGIDGLWHAQRILKKTLGDVEGYQSDDGILEHKAAITAIKKLHEQNYAWSDEDEKMLQNILECLRHGWKKLPTDILKYESWLKSLRPQNNWKPSNEQLECLGYAIEKAEKDWSPLTNNRIYLTLKALKKQLEKL